MSNFGSPNRPSPTPLQCAFGLADAVRLRCGSRGVEDFVRALQPFFSQEWLRELCRALDVPCPPPPPPPPPPPHGQSPCDMERLMQMVRLMEHMKSSH